MKDHVRVGDFVTWHSKKKKRRLTGQVVQLHRGTAAVEWTTFDGKGHKWIVPYWKLKKVSL